MRPPGNQDPFSDEGVEKLRRRKQDELDHQDMVNDVSNAITILLHRYNSFDALEILTKTISNVQEDMKRRQKA